MIVGVIGAGAWGCALGITSARGGSDVVIWSFDGEWVKFPGVDTPNNIKITRNMDDMGNVDVWVIATPAAFFRQTIARASPLYRGQPIIICTKGAEPDTGAFMSDILIEKIPNCKNLGVLSGPQFAAEVASGVPTGSTIGGNSVVCDVAARAFPELYLNPTDDLIGVQLCGVGKNATALICGYNSIVAAGENERALVLCKCWNEIVRIGIAAHARPETFLDLCGVGDLFLSATSVSSRNYSAGISIARGDCPTGTVEGITALSGLITFAKKYRVKTPTLLDMYRRMGL